MNVDCVDMNASVESLVWAGVFRLLQVLPFPQELGRSDFRLSLISKS
jgi:hypothetical protein